VTQKAAADFDVSLRGRLVGQHCDAALAVLFLFHPPVCALQVTLAL